MDLYDVIDQANQTMEHHYTKLYSKINFKSSFDKRFISNNFSGDINNGFPPNDDRP
jgi:hypothetical protein